MYIYIYIYIYVYVYVYIYIYIYIYIIYTGIHSMEDWIATTRHGVRRKRTTKRLKHAGNPLQRTHS